MMVMKKKLIIIAVLVISLVASYILCERIFISKSQLYRKITVQIFVREKRR